MTDSPEPRFGRILLKLSGEALMGSQDFGTDGAEVDRIARQVAAVRDRGVEVAIVVGAGNIYRGIDGAAKGMDRATSASQATTTGRRWRAHHRPRRSKRFMVGRSC